MPTSVATVVVTNEQGLHGGPAMAFGAKAAGFTSAITVCRVDNRALVDATSMLGLLTLMLTQGTEIEISATGEDAEAAVEALRRFVDAGFRDDLGA